MSPNYLYFETERLIIRPTNIDDAEFIFDLLNSPKWIQNIGDRNIKSIKDAANYIATKMRPQLEKLGYSNNTVILKSTNTKIGTCGLYDREGLEGVDIGFAFLPNYEKQGFALESCKEIVRAAKENFKLNALNAITLPSNHDSQHLLIKLGFIFTQMVRIPNDEEELMLFQKKL